MDEIDEAAAALLANDPELVHDFLTESREHLAKAEAAVLALERDPGDSESLNAVFRCFHTIKGLAAFLGAGAIREIAHETENVLALVRSGRLTLSAHIADLILRATDELNRCLAQARPGNLHQLTRCDSALLSAFTAVVAAPEIATALKRERQTPAVNPDNEKSAVRIAISKLEYLIDMVGELVIAASVVARHPLIEQSQDPVLARNIAQFARVLKEVQKTSMSMRMVSVSALFARMSRLTRDLALKLGKRVELVTVGNELEVDRNIVEELADPMVHMIRNAVDHGLECASERRAGGKPETGIVHLRAMHDAGDVVIEIGDDGRGLNCARILAKARRLGLIGEQENPGEDAIFRLILEPGFSTADEVTDVSGRGVGMDVVKNQIQKLRGRISIHSSSGEGCTFVLRVPSISRTMQCNLVPQTRRLTRPAVADAPPVRAFSPSA
jgi:two-component system chemotaxis sensor kinase CheA